MDAKFILDDLFATSKEAARKGISLTEEKLGVPESGENRDAMLSGMGKGAMAAGALALLLGTKSGRSITGTAAKLGGIAAVGGLAYKAFTNWQASKSDTAPITGTPINELDDKTAEERSHLLISAMVSAAKADGHVDQEELAAIYQRVGSLGLDAQTAKELLTEMDAPLDVNALAQRVTSQKEAAEVYLVSAMAVEVDQPIERDYLDRLAGALGLEPDLAQALEIQLNQA